MSGGHFDYQQYALNDISDSIKDRIDYNTVSTLEDHYGQEPYSKEIIDKFKKTSKDLERLSKQVQRIDWLLSGDDGPEEFLERWKKEGLK